MNERVSCLEDELIKDYGYDLNLLRKSYEACLESFKDEGLALTNYELILKAGIEECKNNKDYDRKVEE